MVGKQVVAKARAKARQKGEEMRMDWEDLCMFVLLAASAVLIMLIIIGFLANASYCAFGDIESPRYQYICGHSVDIK